MKAIRTAQVGIAALIGVLYGWMAVNFWGGYAVDSPIKDWFLDALLQRGYRASYLMSIYVHDVIVNVLLAAPVAALLIVFRSLNNWLSCFIAVGMGVVASYWDAKWGSRLLSSWGFWMGLGMSVWSLPIAFAGMRTLRGGSESAV